MPVCSCGRTYEQAESDIRRGALACAHGKPSRTFARYASAELECGGFRYSGAVERIVARWGGNRHDDCSIHGFGETHEVCTAPARGDAFARQIREVTGAIKAAGGRVNASCGGHIHVDARDLADMHVSRFLRLIRHVEDALFRLAAPGRDQGSYCRRLPASLASAVKLADIEHVLYGCACRAANAKRHRYSHAGDRYLGVNLTSLVCHGTVEFRLWDGSLDAETIIYRATIGSALVDAAVNLPAWEIDALCKLDPRDTLMSLVDKRTAAWIAATIRPVTARDIRYAHHRPGCTWHLYTRGDPRRYCTCGASPLGD